MKLTVKGKSQTAPLEVKIDPRLQSTVTLADMQKQIELAMKVQQDIDAMHRAVNQIRELRENLKTPSEVGRRRRVQQRSYFPLPVLDQKMTYVEENLAASRDDELGGEIMRYPNMLNEQYASFNDLIQGVDGAPTAQQLLVFEELHGRLQTQLSNWQQIESAEVPALNEMMRKHGVPTLAVGNGQGD